MPGAIVQAAYAADSSGSTTVSITLNGCVAGNLIAVSFSAGDDGSSTVSSVSDGTAYTADAAGKVRNTTEAIGSWSYYLPNISSGTHTITVTFGASLSFRLIRAAEISGCATSSVEDKAAANGNTTGTGTDAISSGATATTTNANDFVIGWTHNCSQLDPGSGTLSAGTGYTISGTNVMVGLESKSVSATGAQTATFTQSVNNQRTAHVIAFKEAAAGGDPEGQLVGGKLVGGGLLLRGVLKG